MSQSRVTTVELRRMKAQGRKITMLTAYDAIFARLLDRAGVDVLLVGDSLGMVVQGRNDTLKVTVQQIAYHGAAVSRVAERAHIVLDMPFLSYHVTIEDAVRNAGRLIQEGGGHAVKLEGGRERADTIRAIVSAQIPVMGHIGLTPQSVHVMGGFKVQGRSTEAGRRILEDALAVQEAGAYALVLEGIPAELASEITDALDIPTIGIGAGSGCDGQVLVVTDMLGLEEDFKPKFVRRFADLGGLVRDAVGAYIEDVRAGAFPDDAHSFHRKRKRPGKGALAVVTNASEGASATGGKGRVAYGPADEAPQRLTH
jgi:3-methyl-2-oxobutanoate hydroxymethyltransferase